jgi:hypothetical protein
LKKYTYIILFILLLLVMAGGCTNSNSGNTSSKASLPQATETVTPQATETVTPQASEEETPKDDKVVSLEAAKEASEKETPDVTTTSTPTAEKSTSQVVSETPMQLSEGSKKDLTEVAEKHFGAKDVFIRYGNGVMIIYYSLDTIPNPSDLYDDIQSMLIGGYYDAGSDGITDVSVVNVVVTTRDGRGLGVGNYYVAKEKKVFDIDVSDCHP